VRQPIFYWVRNTLYSLKKYGKRRYSHWNRGATDLNEAGLRHTECACYII
jgi:hypothetical protein